MERVFGGPPAPQGTDGPRPGGAEGDEGSPPWLSTKNTDTFPSALRSPPPDLGGGGLPPSRFTGPGDTPGTGGEGIRPSALPPHISPPISIFPPHPAAAAEDFPLCLSSSRQTKSQKKLWLDFPPGRTRCRTPGRAPCRGCRGRRPATRRRRPPPTTRRRRAPPPPGSGARTARPRSPPPRARRGPRRMRARARSCSTRRAAARSSNTPTTAASVSPPPAPPPAPPRPRRVPPAPARPFRGGGGNDRCQERERRGKSPPSPPTPPPSAAA